MLPYYSLERSVTLQTATNIPMSTPSVDQLKRAIAVKEQIQRLESELANILGNTTSAPPAKRKYTKKGTVSAAPSGEADEQSDPKAKRTMSAEGRARIIAAQKARWAKVKKAKKA